MRASASEPLCPVEAFIRHSHSSTADPPKFNAALN